MSDQVEEIKSKIDIVSLISEFIPLKKAGRNYRALCPFHSEKTPSFMVSSELQIFKCFGCGAGGDAFAFLQKLEGMDFYEALKYLAQKTGVKLEPLQGVGGDKEKIYELNRLISRFYNYLLLNHGVAKGALAYLTQARGIRTDTIKEFQLGYSPEAPLALKKYIVDKKGTSLRDLERTGVVYTKNGKSFDRFRGRIIFPLYDHRGNCVGFAGRILPTSGSLGLAKYINTPETEIYHKSRVLYGLNLTREDVKKTGKVYVVEGELDLISLWQVGIKNTVAIKGSALTEDQARLLGRFANCVVLAFDADFAGDEAVRRGVTIAEGHGLEVKVAKLTGFKDPDEAARKDPEGLRKMLEKAKSAWDYILESVFERYPDNTADAKTKVSRGVVPILASISDSIMQAYYIDFVAKKLGVPVEAVADQVSNLKVGKETPHIERVVQAATKSRREILEERLLAVGFRLKSTLLLKKEVYEFISTPLAKRIVQALEQYFKKNKSFDPSLFAAELSPELVEGFTDLILGEIKGLEQYTTQDLEKEFKLVQKELKILDVKERLEELGKRIQQLEASNNNKKEDTITIQEQFQQLTKVLFDLEEDNFGGIIH